MCLAVKNWGYLHSVAKHGMGNATKPQIYQERNTQKSPQQSLKVKVSSNLSGGFDPLPDAEVADAPAGQET